jgi:hypothetical protein
MTSKLNRNDNILTMYFVLFLNVKGFDKIFICRRKERSYEMCLCL